MQPSRRGPSTTTDRFPPAILPLAMLLCFSVPAASPAAGPLRVHPANPRYFADGSGKPVYLTGAHTWNNFQHNGVCPRVEFEEYLDLLERYHHNFSRLWVWEQGAWDPWAAGPCGQIPPPPVSLLNVLKKMADGGGIYTLGFQPGTVLRGNHIHDVRRSAYAFGGAPNNGFFVDNGSKGFLFESNTAYAASGGAVRFNGNSREWHTWKDNRFDAAATPAAIAEAERTAGLEPEFKKALLDKR